jgi:hypothetical protein
MLPIYKVKIIQDMDSSILKFPLNKLVKSRELVANQDYVNPMGYGWTDFEDIHPFEEDAIRRAKEEAGSLDDYFEIFNEVQDEVDCGTLADLGVSGTAIALVNLGYMKGKNGKFEYNCIPITSWMGGRSLKPGYRGDYAFCPNIAGFATPEFGEKLIGFVKNKNIGLGNADFKEFKERIGFVLYTQNIEDMFNFGTFLYEQRKK